ncbi:hypothetical protein BGZ83_010019 [Gryganskiella cystojenkinii]|nr:hypothetical protein BGZ83_010019 [Gryganskiella cystojenkinii]
MSDSMQSPTDHISTSLNHLASQDAQPSSPSTSSHNRFPQEPRQAAVPPTQYPQQQQSQQLSSTRQTRSQTAQLAQQQAQTLQELVIEATPVSLVQRAATLQADVNAPAQGQQVQAHVTNSQDQDQIQAPAPIHQQAQAQPTQRVNVPSTLSSSRAVISQPISTSPPTSTWSNFTIHSNQFFKNMGDKRCQILTTDGDDDTILDRPWTKVDNKMFAAEVAAHQRAMEVPPTSRRSPKNPPLHLFQKNLDSIHNLEINLPCKSSYLRVLISAGPLKNLKSVTFKVHSMLYEELMVSLSTNFLQNLLLEIVEPDTTDPSSSIATTTSTTSASFKSLVMSKEYNSTETGEGLISSLLKCLATFKPPESNTEVLQAEGTSSTAGTSNSTSAATTAHTTYPLDSAATVNSQSVSKSTSKATGLRLTNLEIRNYQLQAKSRQFFWRACSMVQGRLALINVACLGGKSRCCPPNILLYNVTSLEMVGLTKIQSNEQIQLLRQCPNLTSLVWRTGVGKGTKKAIANPLWQESGQKNGVLFGTAPIPKVEHLVLDGDMFQDLDTMMLIDSVVDTKLKKLVVDGRTGFGALSTDALRRGGHLESLVEIDFENCNSVPSRTVQQLFESCPKLEIMHAKTNDVMMGAKLASQNSPASGTATVNVDAGASSSIAVSLTSNVAGSKRPTEGEGSPGQITKRSSW